MKSKLGATRRLLKRTSRSPKFLPIAHTRRVYLASAFSRSHRGLRLIIISKPRDKRKNAHVYVDDPGQWMLGVGAALDGDAQYGLGLLHGDSQVALMIGHHQGAVFFAALRHLAASQPLHAMVSPWRATPGGPATSGPAAGPTLLQQLRLLHVEAPRELVREFLKRAQLAFEQRQSSIGSSIRSDFVGSAPATRQARVQKKR